MKTAKINTKVLVLGFIYTFLFVVVVVSLNNSIFTLGNNTLSFILFTLNCVGVFYAGTKSIPLAEYTLKENLILEDENEH